MQGIKSSQAKNSFLLNEHKNYFKKSGKSMLLKNYDVKYRQHRVMKKSFTAFFSALEAEPGRLKL